MTFFLSSYIVTCLCDIETLSLSLYSTLQPIYMYRIYHYHYSNLRTIGTLYKDRNPLCAYITTIFSWKTHKNTISNTFVGWINDKIQCQFLLFTELYRWKYTGTEVDEFQHAVQSLHRSLFWSKSTNTFQVVNILFRDELNYINHVVNHDQCLVLAIFNGTKTPEKFQQFYFYSLNECIFMRLSLRNG